MDFSIQEEFSDKHKAFLRGEELTRSETYVAVIQSIKDGKTVYFVENEVPLVRVWEKVIHEWENENLRLEED